VKNLVVANYLTIPDVTEAEDLVSTSVGTSERSYNIVLNNGDTAMWLFRAAQDSKLIPLVVLVTDSVMFALDDVYVSAASTAGSYMNFTLDAAGVRTV
jgi:hypothetical protein